MNTKMNEEKQEEKIEKKPVLIPIRDNGAMSFSNQQELGSVALMMMKMNLAPKHLRDGEDAQTAVMSALIMCRQFHLPDTAMNEMAYVKGKLTIFGSLVTSLAERHPYYGEMESFFVDEDGSQICVANKNLKAFPWAHVRRVKRKGASVWNEYFFSVEDAEQAGLLTKTTKADSGWVKYTKDMLSHKTKARALKDNYASALNGVNYYEDVIESIDGREVGPKGDFNDEINKAIEAEVMDGTKRGA